jgi:cytochrome c oxidase accessory protein FixG
MKFTDKRHIVFLIVAIFTLVMPFITTQEGSHMILLSFIKKEFHFFGIVFGVQELHLMPFLIMLLFVGLFAITSLFGRFWCGWLCPQSILRYIFRDLIQTKLLKLRRNVLNKQKEPDYSKLINKFKYVLSHIIFYMIAFSVAINFMLYFVSYDYFFANILDIENHKVLIGFTIGFVGIIVLLVVILKENFCIYACPYAKVQSIMYDKHTFTAVYSNVRGGEIYKDNKQVIFSKKDFNNNEECVACDKCVRVCPTGIDIRKGLQVECIECLECVDACTDVMGSMDKKSLISWSSESIVNQNQPTKLFRFKSIAYLVVISVIVTLLVINGKNKEDFKLNINRTSQLYRIKPTTIQNAYIFLFHNTSQKDHKYYFKVNNPNIQIIRPRKSFTLKAKEKLKKVVALEMDKKFIKNETVIKINITAYEEDNPTSQIVRKSIFVLPEKQ